MSTEQKLKESQNGNMKDDYACVFLLLSAKFLILLLRFLIFLFFFFLGKNVLRDHIEKHDQVMEDSRLMKSGSSHNIQNFTIFYYLISFFSFKI